MNTLQRLKTLRAKTHAIPILAVENELDRIILSPESSEADEEVNKLMRGENLVSGGLEIKLVMER